MFLALVLLFILVILAVVLPKDGRIPRRGILGIVGALALMSLALAFTTIVPAKHYGVLTTFGKVSDRTLTAGLHLKLPWQKVTDIDGTIQTDEYKGDKKIYVRIGDGSVGYVTVTNRWRIVGTQADVIYSDYRSDDPTASLRKAVVSTQFKGAMQEVLGDYNPVDAFEEAKDENGDVKEAALSPDYQQVEDELMKQMEQRLGDDPLVEIQDITISYFELSDTTQRKINDLMAAVADTRIASQKKATAAEEAQANKVLSDSISNDPNVLVSKCFDIVATSVEKQVTLPAGFNCWQGGGSAVVVPAAR